MDIPALTTGHVISDIALWSFVTILVLFRAIEELRKWGVISEKANGGVDSSKVVGRLNVDSFRAIIRHEMRNELDPIIAKISEYNERQLNKLEDINFGIRELIVVSRERGNR